MRFGHCLEAFLAEGVEAMKEMWFFGGGVERFRAGGTSKCILSCILHYYNELH